MKKKAGGRGNLHKKCKQDSRLREEKPVTPSLSLSSLTRSHALIRMDGCVGSSSSDSKGSSSHRQHASMGIRCSEEIAGGPFSRNTPLAKRKGRERERLQKNPSERATSYIEQQPRLHSEDRSFALRVEVQRRKAAKMDKRDGRKNFDGRERKLSCAITNLDVAF